MCECVCVFMGVYEGNASLKIKLNKVSKQSYVQEMGLTTQGGAQVFNGYVQKELVLYLHGGPKSIMYENGYGSYTHMEPQVFLKLGDRDKLSSLVWIP